MEIYQDWTTFKATVSSKVLFMQYEDKPLYTSVWAIESNNTYRCDLENGSADQTDFNTNFKPTANAPVHPVDEDGKPFSRAESRPLDMTTYFTSVADDLEVGDGDRFIFDFNNTDNDVTAPTGFKRKKLVFSFIDGVRVKEGTIYWENMPFGSYMDLLLMVPDQGYYKLNDGTIAQNTTGSPLEIDRFVNGAPMMGDCPMGDELNTEAASAEVPAGTLFCLQCTVPDSVTTSDNCHAYVLIELYRRRTKVLA